MADLLQHALGVLPSGHRQVLGMVGDGQVLVAMLPRRKDHGFEGGMAVGGVGIGMQVALDVRGGHEVRQPAGFGGV